MVRFECEDCGCSIFRPGPRGGMSENVECVRCKSRFNVTIWRGELIAVERISNDTEWREDMFPQILE